MQQTIFECDSSSGTPPANQDAFAGLCVNCYLHGPNKLIVPPTQILLVPLFRTRCCYYEPAHTARYTGEIRVEAVKNFLQLDSSEAAVSA